MTTPVDERPEPTYALPSAPGIIDTHADRTGSASVERPNPNPPTHPHLPSYNINNRRRSSQAYVTHEKTSDEEGTVIGDGDAAYQDSSYAEKENAFPPLRPRAGSHLTVSTQYEPGDPLRNITSSAQTREQANRLNDDLAMLKVERQISRIAEEDETSRSQGQGASLYRSKSRKRAEHVDEFDVATNPVHEQTQVYKPVENPSTGFAKFIKQIHSSNFLVRYFTYIVPVTLILLIPLLLGALLYKDATVGGVYLMWFMIWLEIVWLTLWAGRILAKILPVPIGLASSLVTNNSKKWRDMGKQLELPATLFFWWLAIEVSFLPTMTNHQLPRFPSGTVQKWMNTMNKVLVSLFVGAILNFVEKIIIQLIAISFHLRTYADRIELNKFQIGSLAKLYKYSKEKIAMDDREFEDQPVETGSGARTPGAIIAEAAKTGKAAFSKFGDVAGKIAGDFTGRAVVKSTHPQQVVLTLISSTTGAQVLARRLYRTFAREETETVIADDLRNAFDNDDEADAAFTMFDKDMNGDISMEELEAVCVEIGRERKSITASLKDLDSVVGKLDDVFMFIVFVITVLVFISLISTSAAGVLTSAGSAVLALSWLFSATAQEFLQSCIFVFVKHPFDVGDRVTVYGNAGSLLRGDDFFVKEISLLYTEFKKMEGHIVQAPNSYLNTLFILNQRRSGGLAEAVSITIKFGTTLEQIEGLRNKLLEFVQSEKREYQSNILTELRDINEVHSMNLNVIFFYKSNWQNEGLRLARRNKFICAMMVTMQELGIEGPRMRYPGQRESFPVYLQNVPHVNTMNGHGGQPDYPMGITPQEPGHQEPGAQDPPFVAPMSEREHSIGSQPGVSRMRSTSMMRNGSVLRRESLAQMNRRVDFSLGARETVSDDLSGDVYNDRVIPRVPIEIIEASRERSNSRAASQQPQPSRLGSVRVSNDFARTTSRDSGIVNAPGFLPRRSTDSASARHHGSVHRNRFFGRSGNSRPPPGNGDEANMMENGMADIPENPSGTSSAGAAAAMFQHASSSRQHSRLPPHQHQHQHQQQEHLDPRSGLVSPTAWQGSSSTDVTDRGNLELPSGVTGSGALGVPSPSAIESEGMRMGGQRPRARAATEGVEMRRLD